MASEINNPVMLKRVYDLQFIKKIKESPCLWNEKLPEYKNQSARDAAIESLAKLGKKYNFHYTDSYVKKKVTTYRRGYLREHEKVIAAPADRPFVPRLWYYTEMSFLSQSEDEASSSGVSGVESNIEMTRQRKEHLKFIKELSAGLLSKPYQLRSQIEKLYLDLLNKTTGLENVKIRLNNYGVKTKYRYSFPQTTHSDPVAASPTLEEQEQQDIQETMDAVNSIM